jgi:hypothetical protein
VRRLFTAVVTCSLIMSGTAWAELQKQDRDELFQRIDYMCRDASSVGEVVTYEGSLDAGAILKVIGLGATGKVTKEQWKNIEQKYGEFRGTPTVCRIEMLKLILPLFGEMPPPETWTGTYFTTLEKVLVSVNDSAGQVTWRFYTDCCSHTFVGTKQNGVAQGTMTRTNRENCETEYDVWDMRWSPGDFLTLKMRPHPSCDVPDQGVLTRVFIKQ